MKDKILIVDDEPSNVEALIDFLERSNKEVVYASDIEDAVEHILDAEELERRFDVIISDNHFCQIIPGFDQFDGIDFANAVTGNYDTEDSICFRKAYFGSKTEEIEAHYSNRLIMFSGSAAKEKLRYPDRFRDLDIAQKFEDSQRVACERGVISLLEEKGMKFEEDLESIDHYKIVHNLQNGSRDEDFAHEKAVKEFLVQKVEKGLLEYDFCTMLCENLDN